MHIPTEHPDLWHFFEEHARNVQGTEVEDMGKYRVPKPDMSGTFIYANDPKKLMKKLKDEWFKPGLDSPSVYGKVQGIVRAF